MSIENIKDYQFQKNTLSAGVGIYIKTDIGGIDKSLLKVINNGIGKIGLKASKDIVYPHFQYEMQKFLQEGGGTSGKYAWGYWSRKRGGAFTYVDNARSTWFTNGWRGGKNKEARFPIHPRSYKKYRQKRTQPKSNQYSMIDTKSLFFSTYIASAYMRMNESNIIIRSKNKYLDMHEDGKGVPQRMVFEPIADKINRNKTFNDQVGAYMREEIRKLFEEKGYKL